MPYRIPHSDISIHFEDPDECIQGPPLPSDAVNSALRAATSRLTMQVQRDGDSRIPLSPHHLELKDEDINIVITSVQDYYRPLKYSDAIDVLRGVGAIMRRKGYHEWETHVSDTWAELFYGKVSVKKASMRDTS